MSDLSGIAVGGKVLLRRYGENYAVLTVTKTCKRYFETGKRKWSYSGSPYPRKEWETSHVYKATEKDLHAFRCRRRKQELLKELPVVADDHGIWLTIERNLGGL